MVVIDWSRPFDLRYSNVVSHMAASPYRHAINGMITTHEINPPPTMIAPIRRPRMYPTPRSAGVVETPTTALGMIGSLNLTTSGHR